MTCSLSLLLLVTGFSSACTQANAMTYETVALPRLRPAASLAQTLENDGPISDSVLANDGALWMLGRSNLWRWYPLTGVLQKIRPGSEVPLSVSVRAIGVMGDSVYLALKGRVWRLNSNSGSVQILAGSWPESCTNMRFVGNGDHFALLTSCGALSIDRYGQKIIPLSIPESVKRVSNAVFVSACDCLYGVVGRELIQYKWQGSVLTESTRYEAKANLLGLGVADKHVMTWTSHALLAFDGRSGKRLQVVPASGSRRIVSASFTPDIHIVTFDDGVVELMSPNSRRMWSTKLEEIRPLEVSIDPGGAFAVLKDAVAPVALGLDPLNLGSP